MSVRLRKRFTLDVAACVAYLSEQNPAAAQRLVDELEETALLLNVFPELGQPRDELSPSLRAAKLRSFPYTAYYRIDGSDVVLVRLLHQARDHRTFRFREERVEFAAATSGE